MFSSSMCCGLAAFHRLPGLECQMHFECIAQMLLPLFVCILCIIFLFMFDCIFQWLSSHRFFIVRLWEMGTHIHTSHSMPSIGHMPSKKSIEMNNEKRIAMKSTQYSNRKMNVMKCVWSAAESKYSIISNNRSVNSITRSILIAN